jgi:hypothetical protein
VIASLPHSAVADIGGWPTFISGLIIGALTILTPVAVAWRQRIVQLRDHDAECAQEETRRREQDAREARLARREQWQAEHDAIQNLLEHCEELAYHVRHEGPCTGAQLADLGMATLRMDSERLADRGMPRLREPLLHLVDNLDRLFQQATNDPAEMTVARSSGQVIHRVTVREIQRGAILQDRAERDLTSQITSTWQILRLEWGA